MNRDEIKEYMRGMFDYRIKDYQLDYAEDCLNGKNVVAVFSRQSGKSETTSKVAIMLARKITKAPVLVFAPTERQASLISEKISTTINKMPYLSYFYIKRQTALEYYFSNGGSIICQTVGDKGEGIRGFTAGAIILEEAGSIKDSIYTQVILPMGATTGAQIIKIGTPRGKNHFFESTRNNNFKVHQFDYTHAVRNKIQSQDYVDEVKKSVTDLVWRTEMMAEFIEDQDAYFGYNLIDSCVFEGYAQYVPKQGETYYMGCDIARLGRDATVFMIMKQGFGTPSEVVHIIDIPQSKLDYVVDEIARLDAVWSFNKIFIDETGLGAGVVDFVSRKFNSREPSSERQNNFQHAYKYYEKVVGIKFTIKTKLDIFSNLKNLMEQGLIKYPANPKLIAQLRDFRYELTDNDNVKLHHSDNGFDDYVDALAMAAKALNQGGGVLIDW